MHGNKLSDIENLKLTERYEENMTGEQFVKLCDELYELLNLVLNENYYTLLLGLDGEAALGNVQNAYKLYDEDGNLLNECGEIEEAAYRYVMEK